MKKCYTLLLLFLAISFTVFGQSPYYVSSSGGLNMRKGPGASHPVLTSIPQGSQVALIDQQSDEWWKVRYQQQEGYVSAQYLSKEQPENSRSSKQNNHQRSGNSTASQKNSAGPQLYQYGVGIRLGDPSGISLIKFLPRGKALELNIGRTAFYGFDFKREFESYDDYNEYIYEDANFRSALSFQLHYLSFRDLNIDGLPGLQWYYGLGGQARVMTIDYLYRYRVYHGTQNNDYHWEKRWEKASELDFGVDATIGLNYNFQKLPLSVFVDLTLFTELYDHFLWFRGQGGPGIRYNF